MEFESYPYLEALSQPERQSPKVPKQEKIDVDPVQSAGSQNDGRSPQILPEGVKIKTEAHTKGCLTASFEASAQSIETSSTYTVSLEENRNTNLNNRMKKENHKDVTSGEIPHEEKNEAPDEHFGDYRGSTKINFLEESFEKRENPNQKMFSHESREKSNHVINRVQSKHDVTRVNAMKGNLEKTNDEYPLKKESFSNKRKLNEIYTEELPLSNSHRAQTQEFKQRISTFGGQLWHPRMDEEFVIDAGSTRSTEKIQSTTKSFASAIHSNNDSKVSAFADIDRRYCENVVHRSGFLRSPMEYRCLTENTASTMENVPTSISFDKGFYSGPIDSEGRKHHLPPDLRRRNSPSAVSNEELYKPLCREELLRRTMICPKWCSAFTSPDNSMQRSQKDVKGATENYLEQSLKNESLDYHSQSQTARLWPYWDQGIAKDALDKQRMACLMAEYRVKPEPFFFEESQVKDRPRKYCTIYNKEKREALAVERYATYPSNPYLPSTSIDRFYNGGNLHGLQNVHRDGGILFPVPKDGNMPFQSFHEESRQTTKARKERESANYPCCTRMTYGPFEDPDKARWLDAKYGIRGRHSVLEATKPFTMTQDMPRLASTRIFRVNDEHNNYRFGEKDMRKSEPVPRSLDPFHRQVKRQSSFEILLEAERKAIQEKNQNPQAFDYKIPVDKEASSVNNNQAKKDMGEGNQTDAETTWPGKTNAPEKGSNSFSVKVKEEKYHTVEEQGTQDQTSRELLGGIKREINESSINSANNPVQKIEPEQDTNSQLNTDSSNTKKPISCSVCKKTFNRTSNLYTHMRTHSANKPHACEFCGKRFHQKADLRIHRYIHTGEKPHKCTKCGRGFKQLTHLKYHMRTHSDVRMYKCPYCEKGFNQKSNLQAHIFGHTGQRPHKCEVCGKGFTLASTLNTHKRTHLPNKPFKCDFCDRAFYQKNALKMHYVSTHPYSSGACMV